MTFIRISSFFLLLFNLLFTLKSEAQTQENIEVNMRMVGHQILLAAGDSTSRVLAVERNGEQFLLQFESDFMFTPTLLSQAVDSVLMASAGIDNYWVEVRECAKEEVIYSYEISKEKWNTIPCGVRKYEKDCYDIYITVPGIGAGDIISANGWYLLLFLLIGFPFVIVMVKFKKKQIKLNAQAELIKLGAYQFDKKNMKLYLERSETELSSKEVDLLFLLYSSVDNTLERDHILKVVWGDKGDYVGRTLDVFISKLRKKLEADPNVKIINVRGVGYKLIVNEYIQ